MCKRILFSIVILVVSSQILGARPLPPRVNNVADPQNNLIVVFDRDIPARDRERTLSQTKGYKKIKHSFGDKNINIRRPNKRGHPLFDRMHVIEFNSAAEAHEAKTELSKNPRVSYVESDFIYHADIIPNDPFYGLLWGMNKINAPRAWDTTTGSSSVIVGVIDTGTQYTHPDLAANIWINEDEIPDNGIDDDGNGFIDDIHGWDFHNNDNDPDDDESHGTHTAGTIGAVGNNGTHLVGVNWNVSIMPLKFLDETGNGSGSDAIKCFQYALNNGARVTNNSWGGGNHSQAMQDIISVLHQHGVLTVASSGNGGNGNVHYPAGYDNVFTVGAIDINSVQAYFSSFGKWVNITAPGVDVYSLFPNGFGSASGTSMSCPHVAGVAALVLSVSPNLSMTQLQFILESTAQDIGEPGRDDFFGAGIVDAAAAVELASTPEYSRLPEIRIDILPKDVFEDFDISGTVTGEGFVSYQLQVQRPGTSEWEILDNSTTPVIDGFLGIISPQPSWADGQIIIRIVVTRDDGLEFIFDATTLLKTTVISSPTPYMALNDIVPRYGAPHPGSVDIRGSSRGNQFQSYELSWGVGLNPTTWTLFHSSNSTVSDDDLGEFNIPTDINDEYISVLLTSKYSDGSSKKYSYPYSVSRLLPGFPVAAQWNVTGFNDPIMVGGILGEPLPLILGSYTVGPLQGALRIFRESTGWKTSSYYGMYDSAGLIREGWSPILIGQEGRYGSASSIVDINNDGITEIIFVIFEATGLMSPGGWFFDTWYRPVLFAMEPDGTALFSVALGNGPPGIYPEDNRLLHMHSRAEDRKIIPTIVDLNNDGQLDIVVGSDHTGSVHAINNLGEELPGFPIVIPDANSNSFYEDLYWPQEILVSDSDGDGDKELTFFVGTNSNIFRLYKYNSDGTFNSLLLQSVANQSVSIIDHTGPQPPVAADLDGDGFLETIVGLYDKVYAFDRFGELLPGWPPSPAFYTGLSIGDVDSDELPEVITQGFDHIGVYNADGSSPNGWPKSFNDFGAITPSVDKYHTNTKSNPLVADVDGDGDMDMLFRLTVSAPYREVWDIANTKKNMALGLAYAFDIEGNILSGFPKQITEPDTAFVEEKGGFGSMAVADLDGNGTLDLIAGTSYISSGFSFFTPEYQAGFLHPGNIKAWSLDGTLSEWPLHRKDTFNTGIFHGCKPSICGDGICDADDYSLFMECLSGPNSVQEGCTMFDIDCDGDVDLYDFAKIVNQ